MQEFIAGENIKHFKDQLKLSHTEQETVVLERLLRDEELKLAGLIDAQSHHIALGEKSNRR